MVINFRVDFEITDNRANNLVVGAVSAVENLKFPLKDCEQLLNIAMLLEQALNDHGSAPHSEPQRIIPDAAPALCARSNLGRNRVRRFDRLKETARAKWRPIGR